MKKSVLLLLLLISSYYANARGVNLDNERYTLNYRWYPVIVYDSTFVTYSTEITKPASVSMFAENLSPTLLKIDGLKYVETGGDLRVTLKFDNLIITQAKVVNRVEESKDRDGKVTSSKTYYRAVVVYTLDSSAKIVDKNNKSWLDFTIPSTSREWESREFGDYQSAAGAYNNNREVVKSEIATKSVNDAISFLNVNLNQGFGYPESSDRILFQSLGSKKDEEYVAFNGALKAFQDLITKITAKALPQDAEVTTKASIDYFLSVLEKYKEPGEKFQKQYRYAALMNLAQFYYCLEQYDKAKMYAQKIVDNDYDPKDGKKIIEKIDKIRDFYAKRHVNTCHFLTRVEK